MVQIKVCGLTKTEEVASIVENGVDFIGMVLFFEKSKRNITIEKACDIISVIPDGIKKVAVVVSPSVEQAKCIEQAGFDIIQIHGEMSREVYDSLGIDIWKAFNIKDMEQYASLRQCDKITGFVFDSATPGSGMPYDLDILSNIERVAGKKFILAGGLRPENVAEAIVAVNPDLVDVSSGIEFDNIQGKDPNKIKEFVKSVQNV